MTPQLPANCSLKELAEYTAALSKLLGVTVRDDPQWEQLHAQVHEARQRRRAVEDEVRELN